MRIKMFLRAVCIVILAMTAIPPFEASARRDPTDSLYDDLWGKTLLTYIAEPVDPSGKAGQMVQPVLEALRHEMSTRLNFNFKIAGSPEGADLLIETDVKEYTPGSGEIDGKDNAGIFGMFSQEGRASIEAVISVTDLARKKLLWRDRVRAETDVKGLASGEAADRLAERLASNFIKECFSKRPIRGSLPGKGPEITGKI
ncbi:MAG: hypothetical protein PHT95_07690 [Candidatus Omnitrophica bacterium]|nr:hypothetical protein [Candidatus Omnitrophota bacterium]